MVTVLIFLGSCCSPSLHGVVALSHSSASSCKLWLLSCSVSALSTYLSFGVFLTYSSPFGDGCRCSLFLAWSVFGSHPSVSWRFDLWVLASLPWSWAFLSLGRSTMLGVLGVSRPSSSYGFISLSCYVFVGWFLLLGASVPHTRFLLPARGYLCWSGCVYAGGALFSSILLAPTCPLPLAVPATGA